MKHKVIPLNNVTLDYYHDNFIKTAQAKLPQKRKYLCQ